MTATGLRLVACAATPALRRATFGGDDECDEGGLRAALVLVAALGRGGSPDVRCSPARAAAQTAGAAGLDPVVEPALADCAYGRWEGRPLAGVLESEPEAVRQWLDDPGAAPHGGESFVQVMDRVGAWMDGLAGERVVAVTHPVVIRAALVHALGLPAGAHRRIDVAPLSVTGLRARSGRWTLHLPPAG
jgi:broad specificity phosphatase PhoE